MPCQLSIVSHYQSTSLNESFLRNGLMILYIADRNSSSWSLRAWLIMRRMGLDFTEQLIRFDKDGSYAKFRGVSPTGQLPCLHDGDIIVWDTIAITEYLAERHPEVWPADPRARTWARSAVAEMHSGFTTLRAKCPLDISAQRVLGDDRSAIRQDLLRLEELWQDGLKRFGGPYLAGDRFTAADAFFAPIAFRLETYQIRLGAISMAYAATLLALPEMREWRALACEEVRPGEAGGKAA